MKIRIFSFLLLSGIFLVIGTASAQDETKPNGDLGRIAYVQDGDIWIKYLLDGHTRRVTTDGANRNPRWSDSGEWLAFRKQDDQVWISSTDGSTMYSVDEGAGIGDFVWNPAQDQLAFASQTGLEIIEAGETDASVLVSSFSTTQIDNIAWSPDGTQIAYEQWEQSVDGQLTDQGLWIMSPVDGTPVEVYSSGAPQKGEATLAGWTGDGSQLILWQGPIASASLQADGVPLYAISTDGGEPIQLADDMLPYDDFVAPEPDNPSGLAVVAGGGRNSWTNKSLTIVEAFSGQNRTLTPSDVAVSSPDWRPDGEQIVCTFMPDTGDLTGGDSAKAALMQRHIAILNVDDPGTILPLTDDPAYRDEYPLWSPDGSVIIFVRLDESDQASLWLTSDKGARTPQPIIESIGPIPEQSGYFGHMNWHDLFDWWQGA